VGPDLIGYENMANDISSATVVVITFSVAIFPRYYHFFTEHSTQTNELTVSVTKDHRQWRFHCLSCAAFEWQPVLALAHTTHNHLYSILSSVGILLIRGRTICPDDCSFGIASVSLFCARRCGKCR